MPLVLQASRKRANEGSAGGHRHVCLTERIYKVYVDPVTLFGQCVASPNACLGNGHFEYRFSCQRQVEQAVRFIDDFVVRVTERFDLQFGHHLR